MSEERNGFIEEIKKWSNEEQQNANATIIGAIKSLPANSAEKVNAIVEKYNDEINKNPKMHCERIMTGGGGKQYKYDPIKKCFIFQERIYAVKGENGYDGIVERIFTKRKRYNSIPEKISDETLNKINKETGHNLTRFELLLLSGYVFVESDGDINIDSITGCVPAICYIDPEYDYQNGSLIQNYRFTDSDGKELDEEEIKKIVELVMSEIERIETVNENISEKANQGEQR